MIKIKKMEKNKLAIVSLCVLLLPVVALAVTQPQPGTIGSLQELVDTIETAVWVVFGLIAVVCFVVAGILFLTAGGAPEKVASARSAAIWGVVGIVVGIIAYSIIEVVNSIL